MPVDLDDLKLLSKIDRSNMIGAIDRFPDVFLRSRDEVGVSLTKTKSSFQSLVLMGMGGSASAADVVLDWLKRSLPIPSVVHREPGLPGFVSSRTLFIALSYSGETAETLAAFREAKSRGSTLVGIGHGGSLASLCHRFNAPFVEVEASVATSAALDQMIVRDAEETAFERSIVRAFRSTISSASRSHPLDVHVASRGSLSRLLSPILLLDYVSVYLAMLRRIDPTPTNLINEYKKR